MDVDRLKRTPLLVSKHRSKSEPKRSLLKSHEFEGKARTIASGAEHRTSPPKLLSTSSERLRTFPDFLPAIVNLRFQGLTRRSLRAGIHAGEHRADVVDGATERSVQSRKSIGRN